jgi:cyclopropane-fatty-acyl-phospholipid synthase
MLQIYTHNGKNEQSSLPQSTIHHESGITRLLAWSLPALLLRLFVHKGNLTITCQNSALPALFFGDGSGPAYYMDVKEPDVFRKLLKDPDLYMGESYIDGDWELTRGDLGSFLTMLCHNSDKENFLSPMKLVGKNLEHRNNNPILSRKNVHQHYDLGNDLYQSFLDRNMNYSCAFFVRPNMSLAQAQQNKVDTTIKRLDVKARMNVLDIGCGWGYTCRELARKTKADTIKGITLAEKQAAYARENMSEGQRTRLQYLLEDYRDHAKTHKNAYDRIVSIGMFEHVGGKQQLAFFESVRNMLKPGGRALIHTILRPTPNESPTSIWLDKYIFPGGCIPYLPDMLEKAEECGLELNTPYFILASHNYAETLRHWRKNFNKNNNKLAPLRYDQRFRRMWNYYLATSEAAFDGLGYYVGQMVFKRA